MVFLILAAQYEKWSLPLSVLLALPFGTFGALAAVWLRGLTNDVYFQIGLVTLLGLAAKNAILIVEYAVLKKHEGHVDVGRGARSGAPALPADPDDLARVHPRRAAARDLDRRRRRRARTRSGTGVMGGMLAATFLAIFFVPLFFKLITDRKLRENAQRRTSCTRKWPKASGAAPRCTRSSQPRRRRRCMCGKDRKHHHSRKHTREASNERCDDERRKICCRRCRCGAAACASTDTQLPAVDLPPHRRRHRLRVSSAGGRSSMIRS